MDSAAATVTLLECDEPDDLLSVIPGVTFRAVPTRPGPFHVRLASFACGDLVFQTGECSPMLAMGNVVPSGRAYIQLPFDGIDGFILNGRPLEPGSFAVYGEAGAFDRKSMDDTRHLAIGLPVEMAEEQLGLASASPMLRSGAHATYLASPTAWTAAAELARAAYAMANGSDVFGHEEACRSLRSSLLHVARGLMADAREGHPVLRPVRGSTDRRRIVSAADAFLREYPSRAIYTEELCQVLGVSPTRIAEAFRATFGISPHRFLKLRRMAMVRAALRARGAETVPLVKTVALSHGFWHLGQFAQDYKALYGELPSETRAHAVS